MVNTNSGVILHEIARIDVPVMKFSPLEDYLVTYEKFKSGDNLFFWNLLNGGKLEASFEWKRPNAKEALDHVQFNQEGNLLFL